MLIFRSTYALFIHIFALQVHFFFVLFVILNKTHIFAVSYSKTRNNNN